MSLETRQTAELEIASYKAKTGLPLETLLRYAGIPQRTWFEWKRRRGVETGHNNNIPKNYYLTPEEVGAVIKYRLENPLKGCRVLCCEMTDKNIAFVSASSVYNVLKRHGLLKKWAEASEKKKKGFDQPAAVHEQWHIDFSYVKVYGVFYYFLGILDGFSRKMLNWRLCRDMEGINAEVLVTRAKELYPGTGKVRIISDNGGQFVSNDFKKLAAYLELEHTRISAKHPQSNGKLERFNRTFKDEHVRRTAYSDYEDACAKMEEWVAYYNSQRLHSAISYLTPDDVFYGRASERLAERKEKLQAAFIKRQEYWQAGNAYS